MKKFTSLLLALIMALSLAVPAFAVNKDTDFGQSTKIGSTVNEATIKVRVPDTVTAVLNPYSIGYKVNSTWLAAETYNQGQIASSDNLIISQSNIPLDVYVNVVGTPTTGITLESASVGTKKTKSVYMYVQFSQSVDTRLVKGEGETSADAAITAALAATHNGIAPPVYGATPTFTGNNIDGIVIKTTALSKPVLVGNLAEVPYAKASAEATAETPTTVSAVAYKLGGDMVIAPENNGAANNWVKTDKVDVTFTFTFVPGTAGIAADYTGARKYMATNASAALEIIDVKAILTATGDNAPDWTTGANTIDSVANYTITNCKIDGKAAVKGEGESAVSLVTMGKTTGESPVPTGKVSVSQAAFVDVNAEDTAPFAGTEGLIHYVTFDLTYKDTNEWTITKTIKVPVEMGTAPSNG